MYSFSIHGGVYFQQASREHIDFANKHLLSYTSSQHAAFCVMQGYEYLNKRPQSLRVALVSLEYRGYVLNDTACSDHFPVDDQFPALDNLMATMRSIDY